LVVTKFNNIKGDNMTSFLYQIQLVLEQIFSPEFFATTNNQSYYRRFAVSLNYRFGKLKDEIKKN